MSTVPLWTLAEEKRQVVEPAVLGSQVMHYSIPAVDRLGTGAVEETSEIQSSKLLLSGGEVLISKLNPRKSRVVVVDHSEYPIVSSTEFIGLEPGVNVEPRYLFYFLQSESVRQHLDSLVQSVTRSHQRVSPEDVLHAGVPRMEKEEQRRIADFLDAETSRIDRLVNLQTTVLSRLEERGVAQRDLALDELETSGRVIPFRRFIWSVDQGVSPQCEAVPAEAGEWGVLKVSCLRPGVFLPGENKRLPDDVVPHTAAEVESGDLLITRANTPSLVGSTAVVRDVRPRLLLSDKIFRVRLSGGILPEFAAEVAAGSKVRSLCGASSNGASQTMANIRFEEVKAWPIPFVPLVDQKNFVASMASSRLSVECLRQRIVRQLELLAERRQALITAAVTGQFDVSTASGRTTTQGV
ncbi:hypothetical protein [Nocardia wallacei]|uniref:hypothetical protein n=1 Tax=Nocardia wallacei TaxID=480035 RepID=UPI002454DA61|nr:hypothetical protein [Nocardia wallacei]